MVSKIENLDAGFRQNYRQGDQHWVYPAKIVNFY